MTRGYWQTMVAGAFDRAREHAPAPDRETARVAAHELRARGLTTHDIAAALRLSEGAVRALLEEAR
jgi:DNA-binding NarL/FixJ family response regulator